MKSVEEVSGSQRRQRSEVSQNNLHYSINVYRHFASNIVTEREHTNVNFTVLAVMITEPVR